MSAATMTSRKKMITAPSWYSILMIYLIRYYICVLHPLFSCS
uniref:Uncharacterized protein n=1 Tax=Setaria italica TaxID=4555 RepID=K3ZFX3_SETIT